MIVFKNKLGIISVFEIALLLLLFSSSLIYFNISKQPEKINSKLVLNSVLDSIYYNNLNRKIFLEENLSSSLISENWTNISNYLNLSISNYELIISNNSVSKTIFNCNETFEKHFSQRVIVFENGSIYKFRLITLGVCS